MLSIADSYYLTSIAKPFGHRFSGDSTDLKGDAITGINRADGATVKLNRIHFRALIASDFLASQTVSDHNGISIEAR